MPKHHYLDKIIASNQNAKTKIAIVMMAVFFNEYFLFESLQYFLQYPTQPNNNQSTNHIQPQKSKPDDIIFI